MYFPFAYKPPQHRIPTANLKHFLSLVHALPAAFQLLPAGTVGSASSDPRPPPAPSASTPAAPSAAQHMQAPPLSALADAPPAPALEAGLLLPHGVEWSEAAASMRWLLLTAQLAEFGRELKRLHKSARKSSKAIRQRSLAAWLRGEAAKRTEPAGLGGGGVGR
jgi:hypothetical protein